MRFTHLFYLILLVLSFATIANAQVGVGTASPDASARLQIDANASTNAKGFLPPRVELSSTAATSNTISNPATGLLVFNTATAGIGANAVTPGFYFFNGSAWIRLIVPTDNAANVTGTVAVANGGTGATSLTAKSVLVGNGTNALRSVAPGDSGNVLTSNGSEWVSAVNSGPQKIYSKGVNSDLGGYVFYVTPDRKHGLVAAEQDQSIVSWPKTGVEWYEASDYVANPDNHNANGKKFSDWRVPTKFELNLMFQNKSEIGNFINGNYWSSSFGSTNGNHWWQDFFTGNQGVVSSYPAPGLVRAVRSF